MTNIRPIRLVDLLLLAGRMRPWDARSLFQVEGIKEYDRFAANLYLNCIAAWTLLEDDVVLGSAGFNAVRDGVVYLWALGTDDLDDKHARAWLGFMRPLIEGVLEKAEVFRIETYVFKDFEGGHTTIKHLGFVAEGEQRGIDRAGNDIILYARTRK